MIWTDGNKVLEAIQWTGGNYDAIEVFVGRKVKRIGRWNLHLIEGDPDTIVSKDDYLVKSECYHGGLGVENKDDFENVFTSGADLPVHPLVSDIDDTEPDDVRDTTFDAGVTISPVFHGQVIAESDYTIIEKMLERHEAALKEDRRSITKIRARDALVTLLSLLPREG